MHIEVSTGSLGQGLSIAVGMALALRLDENKESMQYITSFNKFGISISNCRHKSA